MSEGGGPATSVFIVGVLTVAALLVKAGLKRIGLPSLVGFLAFGLLFRYLDDACGICREADIRIVEFLAKAGLVALLFRVGLESNLKGLLGQLRTASAVWVADVLVSGTLGYATSRYLLGLAEVPSLVVATAFTATSVGITVVVWQEMNALKSRKGELLVDLAELDDISAVVLMALLFSQLPRLKAEGLSPLPPLEAVAAHAGGVLLKLVLFGMSCFLFSRWVEKPLTRFFRRLESGPDLMLTVAGIGFVIAALAELLGFSMAIGAFFAGLIFCRDPDTVKMESAFMPVYDFLSPFFFIGIGLNMDPAALGAAVQPAAALALAAIGGKLIADGLPLWPMAGGKAAVLIGASMTPRAEITMAIMEKGHGLGEWAVPARVYNAMVLVSAVTCILGPLGVRMLLKRWQPAGTDREQGDTDAAEGSIRPRDGG